jgi:cytochrome c oxidase subunit II
VVLALFFASTAVAAFGHQIHPPSHIETIDPSKALVDQRFRRQGVSVDRDGRVQARVVGLMFAWLPAEMTIPADTPVTFHLTSIDVIHGFEIVRTNGQAMVVPGYISQFTTRFAAGEYLIACNEYCGVGHHTMAAKLHVVPASQWQAPAREVADVR